MKKTVMHLLAAAALLSGCGKAGDRAHSLVANIEDSDSNVLVSTFLTMPDKRSVSVKLVNRETRNLECEVKAQVVPVLEGETIGELSLFQKAPLAASATATLILGEEDIRDQTPGVHYRLSGTSTVTRCRASTSPAIPTPTPGPTPIGPTDKAAFERYFHATMERGGRIPIQSLESMCFNWKESCFARGMHQRFDALVIRLVSGSGLGLKEQGSEDWNRRKVVLAPIVSLAIAAVAVGSEEFVVPHFKIVDEARSQLGSESLVEGLEALQRDEVTSTDPDVVRRVFTLLISRSR